MNTDINTRESSVSQASQERTGVIFVLLSTAIWGAFPVLVHYGVQSAPPLTLAALSVSLAAVCTFIYALVTGKLIELRQRKVWKAMALVALCIVIIPNTLFFLGAQHTSGINSSMLQLAELIFLIIITPWFGEPNTSSKLLGSGGVLIGAAFLLYNGTAQINIGDVLVIVSTLTYPIGNFYAKRALTVVSPIIVLLVRFALGGVFLLALAWVVEGGVIGQGFSMADGSNVFMHTLVNYWPIIVAIGFVSFTIDKILWYEGLRRLDISKAVSLAMTFPLFSLVYIVIFTGEQVSGYQWIGIAIMTLGIWFTIRRPSVDIKTTKYGKHLT